MRSARSWADATVGPGKIKPRLVPMNGPAPEVFVVTDSSLYDTELPQQCSLLLPDSFDDGVEFELGDVGALGYPASVMAVR